MSDLTNTFTDIADAIRAKTSTTIAYKPTEMANAINNISVGMTLVGPHATVTGQFNQPVTISDNVTNMANAFRGCQSFNQPITIPSGVTTMANAFSGCYVFNQPITIPSGVTNMSYAFEGCIIFNYPITILNGVTNIAFAFGSCHVFNQSITIPVSVTNLRFTFLGCDTLNNSTVKIHISRTIAIGNTSNYIYNALVNNFTGINWTGRILNDA